GPVVRGIHIDADDGNDRLILSELGARSLGFDLRLRLVVRKMVVIEAHDDLAPEQSAAVVVVVRNGVRLSLKIARVAERTQTLRRLTFVLHRRQTDVNAVFIPSSTGRRHGGSRNASIRSGRRASLASGRSNDARSRSTSTGGADRAACWCTDPGLT